MRAFARLVQACPTFRERVRLAIVGDGPLLQELRDLATSLHIADVTWLPGARTDVPTILQGFDVFVLPSLFEGISNTILEAMACGLPVVATAVGGNEELVSDGQTGRVFQPQDIDALTGLLTEYIAHPAWRHEHAAAARGVAVERFSLSTMITTYQHLYESLCRSGRPA
jgi:glycosyltransferase involved in cell wall biosynthesis